MNGTSGISGLTGGNLLDPPEPVLSRAEWERRRGWLPIQPIRTPCQVPTLTVSQRLRVAAYRGYTEERGRHPGIRSWAIFPLFDDEPTVRCEEVRCVSRVE